MSDLDWMYERGQTVVGPAPSGDYYRLRRIGAAEFAHEGVILMAGVMDSAKRRAEAEDAPETALRILNDPQWRETYVTAQKRLIPAAVIGVGRSADRIRSVVIADEDDPKAAPPRVAVWRLADDEAWIHGQIVKMNEGQGGPWSFFRLLGLSPDANGDGPSVP